MAAIGATFELRDLRKRYGETVALDGASFGADRGESTGRAWRSMAVSILLVVWIAGRVYQRSVLRFGTPMKLPRRSPCCAPDAPAPTFFPPPFAGP